MLTCGVSCEYYVLFSLVLTFSVCAYVYVLCVHMCTSNSQLDCELPEGRWLSFLLQPQVGLAQGWAPNSQENTCQLADEYMLDVGGGGGRRLR